MPNESAYTAKLLRTIRRDHINVTAIKLSERYVSGMPDFLICTVGGSIAFFEAKVNNEPLTKLQTNLLTRFRGYIVRYFPKLKRYTLATHNGALIGTWGDLNDFAHELVVRTAIGRTS